jgi:hypothetical protein
MKTKLLSIALLSSFVSVSIASPSIEQIPTGARKYYKDGYIEVVCPDAKNAQCLIEIRTKFGLIKHKLDLWAYGYARAWEPVGAFLDMATTRKHSISFYFSVDCSKEDYEFVGKDVGEVRCDLQGDLDRRGVVLKLVEITPLSGDGPVEYRALAMPSQ